MGKVVKAAAGIGLIGLGAFTGGLAFLPGTALAFTVGSSSLVALGLSVVTSTLLSPKVRGAGERQAAETTLQLGETPRQAGFGRFATAGSLADGFNFGGQYETDWEVLLLDLADHECDALEGFYVNDEYVAFGGNGAVTGYSGQLEVYFMPGTAAQTYPSIVTANSDFTNADNAKGVARAVVAYKADDPESENPVWTGGRPRFLFVLRGKKCYDPRKDSTVTGGSGAHRYNAPSTWEWTDNPAVCRYQYQRGIYALDQVDQPDQLLIGRGLSATEAPPERVIAHAAVCDELVALKGGETEKRYTFNGMIGADEDFLTAEGYFAAACGGIIRQPEGGIEVEPGQPKAVVAEITDLDILNLSQVELEFFRGEADSEWINTVTPRYIEPEQKWSIHSAPIRRDNADVVADGGQRIASPELKHVTGGTQAQRLAEIIRRMGRLGTTASIPLGPRFAELEEGDWIGWTSARHFGGARRVFRIENYSRDIKWHMALRLREISADVFGWTAATDEKDPLAVAVQQTPPPAIGEPGAGAWTFTAGAVTGALGSQPALFISGAIDDARAEKVRFEYRETGDTAWITAGDSGPGTVSFTVRGVADGTSHEVAVRYLVDGTPGPRRVLAAATTGDLDDGGGGAPAP